MPIVQLVRKDLVNIPELLPIVGSSYGLLAFVETSFELVVEICVRNKNNYQHRYRKNLKSTKDAGTIRQTSIVPRE